MRSDETGFTSIYEEHYGRVLGYAQRRTAADSAREVADEVFLIAWRRREGLPEAVLPWLLVTARNVLSEHHRRGHRADALVQEIARTASVVHEAGPDETVLERLTVLTALTQLSDSHRDLLIMTVWDGLSPREAARVAGCSPATVTVRLHRARQSLTRALERADADDFAAHQVPHDDQPLGRRL